MTLATRLAGAFLGFIQPPQRRPGSTWEHDPPGSSMRPPPMPAEVMRQQQRVTVEPGLLAIERPDGTLHVSREERWTREPPMGPGWFECQWHSTLSSCPPVVISEVVASPDYPLRVRNERGELELLSSVQWWGTRVPLQGPPPGEENEVESWG